MVPEDTSRETSGTPEFPPTDGRTSAGPTYATPAPSKPKGPWVTLGGLGLLALGKLKYLLGFLKFGKVFLTLGTMLLSVWAYAQLYPVPFAIGFVLLILIHEMGHVWVLTRYGMKASAPVFIPFVGAMIGMKEMPKNVEMEAWVGYGGPLLGGIAAFLCYYLSVHLHDDLLLHLSHVGFFLNLFNLVPISPLDGGRITAAISRWFWVVGWGLLLFLFLTGFQHPIILVILFLGGFKLFSFFFKRNTDWDPSYYQIKFSTRIWITLAYFSLVFALAFMSQYTDYLIRV